MNFDFLGFGGAAINVVVIIMGFLVLAGFAFLIGVLIKERKKWAEYTVFIMQFDHFGQLMRLRTDQGAIFTEPKANSKRLHIRNAKSDMDGDFVPYFEIKGKKYVFVGQNGLKNFYYLQIILDEEGKPKLQVTEQDVNWAVNSYVREQKKWINNPWMQYAPYIALVFTGMAIIIMVYFVMQKFAMIENMLPVLEKIADRLAAAASGTTVIQG